MRKVGKWWVALMSVLFLAACGGGGGNDGSTSTAGIAYNGVTTAAVIDEENAAELSVGAYETGTTTDSMTVMALQTSESGDSLAASRVALLAEVLESVVLEVDGEREGNYSRAATETVQGFHSGYYTFTQTGETSGIITFTNYSDDGEVFLDGGVSFSVALDGSQNLESMTLSYSKLTTTYADGSSFTASGSMTIVIGTQTDTVSVSMTMEDELGKTYKIENYQIVVDYAYGTVEISGKFYHPDYGYVTLSTPTPLATYYASDSPTGGVLRCDGDNSWVELAFTSTVANGRADTDGDDIADLFFTYDPHAASGEEITYVQ